MFRDSPTTAKKNSLSVEISFGKEMHDLIVELFPICRSLTGDGVRQSLEIIKKHIPIEIHEVASGTKVFDWVIPKEWNIRDGFILDEKGNKIVDFKRHNLHVVGYSSPVDQYIPLSELQQHLHSLPEQPEAIPYVTSFYEEYWGFCISQRQRDKLKEGRYRIYIDSELKDGYLTYGECLIKGETDQEVFLSTYICHPSMANNELSGPAVTTFLIKWILSAPRKYSYRIIFIPETIGSITYLSRNIEIMRNKIIAGFNITCVGDDRAYSFLPSRNGNTLADKAALNILRFKHPEFISYSYLDRGSDERQYCSPGVDLPVVSIMRSKYGSYPEYHTSLDDLDLVSPEGLNGSYEVLKDCLELIEKNNFYQVTCLGEPQLGKRGLYPNLSTKNSTLYGEVTNLMNFLAYADGSNDLIDISNIINVPVNKLYKIIEKLELNGLLIRKDFIN
jgi:aminopeptidase-like protein